MSLDHQHHMNPHIPHHPFEQQDAMDSADHSNYTLFQDTSSSPAAPAFHSQRYRTNASSSSSLGHGYALNSDNMYHNASFSDSVPPFSPSSAHPYDMMNMNSGKASPIASEPLHHPGAYPPPKEYHPPQPFSDIHDRRLPGVPPNGYHSEYPDDYAMGGINNNNPNIPFPHHSPIQQFPDRLGRYPPDRYTHQALPPSNVAPHIANTHSTDLMRGVPPHATHSFRDNNVPPYDDMHYIGNAHPQEIRMHAVDETLSRMKLHGNPMMGPSNDLHSFIR